MLETNKQSFNGLFSRKTWVSKNHEGKSILDINEAKCDGMAVASAEPYANHWLVSTQKAVPAPHDSIFYRLAALF